MSGFDNDTVFANNVDFSGGNPVTGKVTTDGQLLIGSTAAPNIRVGSLTSSGGTIAFTVGAGTINAETSGTSTTQPGGSWTVGTPTANATGDGTALDVIFDSEAWQQGANYNTGTGKYTVPTTGVYVISGLVTFNNLSASFDQGELNILSSAGTYTRLLFNPGLTRDSGNNCAVVFSGINKYNAADTIYINVAISGGTKTVGIKELSFGGYSILNIMKVA